MTLSVTEILQNYLLLLWYFVNIDVWESKNLCLYNTKQVRISIIFHLDDYNSLLIGLCTATASCLLSSPFSTQNPECFYSLNSNITMPIIWNSSLTPHQDKVLILFKVYNDLQAQDCVYISGFLSSLSFVTIHVPCTSDVMVLFSISYTPSYSHLHMYYSPNCYSFFPTSHLFPSSHCEDGILLLST